MSETVAQALAAGVARLRAADVPDPARDARRLLAHALGVRADRLTLHMPDAFPTDAVSRWDAAVNARAARQPVAQIVGSRAFYGRSFHVTSDVLDPRPETETLIAEALQHPAQRILDIGTGSGCILLTLLAEWSEATGIGTDMSPAALAVATQNATALDVAARAELVHTNWADAVAGPFDLIVSNPPYISGAEMTELSRDVLDWEPHAALTPGPLGLESYRALIPQAADLLAAGGRLLLEIGPTQGAEVASLCVNAALEDVYVRPDLDGRDRVVTAVKSTKASEKRPEIAVGA